MTRVVFKCFDARKIQKMAFAVLIFSEGFALILQLIIFRYPNEVDTVTWTWNQSHGANSVLWLTLAQPFSRASVEFLPVYTPSSEEKEDPTKNFNWEPKYNDLNVILKSALDWENKIKI